MLTVTPAAAFVVEVVGERAAELVAAGGESILVRAAERFAAAVGLADPPAVRVRLDKRIPVAAGMGGGSADAAALLRALGREHGTEPERLAAIAAEVGADVPRAPRRRPRVRRGPRGARRAGPRHRHPVGREAVRGHRPRRRRVRVVGPGSRHRAGPRRARGRVRDRYVSTWSPTPPRTTSSPGSSRASPAVGAAIEAFRGAGALTALMTGSGPTVVALASDPAHADRIAAAVRGSIVTAGPPRTMAV